MRRLQFQYFGKFKVFPRLIQAKFEKKSVERIITFEYRAITNSRMKMSDGENEIGLHKSCYWEKGFQRLYLTRGEWGTAYWFAV